MRKILEKWMKLSFLLLLLSLGCLSFAQTPQPPTIVNTNPTDGQILNLLRGTGLQNIYLGTGDGLVRGVRNRQIAIFKDGTQAGYGMDEGILFSTGNAHEDLSHRNSDIEASYFPQGNNFHDNDLKGIFEQAIYDVVIYKFKVTLEDYTSAIRVEFQFGSEEYPDFVGSLYNDAFGFFIRPAGNGATLPGGASSINMARLPQSNNPISVNTVNYGYAGVAGMSNYPGLDLTQSAHYIRNGHSTNISGGRIVTNTNPGPFPIYIEYNGLTKLLTYDLTGLTPGGTYEFKIAIADSGDGALDSGVMIKKIHGTTGADVRIIKEVDNENPLIDSEVEFTLTADNLGPYDAQNTWVSDLLSNGYEYISHTASTGNYNPITGIWQIGTLQAIHQTETLKIRARIKGIGIHENVASITSDQLDPNYENNTSSVNPITIPPCIDEYVFLDDFGTSDSSINKGRTTSPYMPDNGYLFGEPYPNDYQNPTNPYDTWNHPATIDNGYYAVVAPGFVKSGWRPDNLGYYFWTPSYEEPGAITDISGRLEGAVMAVNGGNQIKPFYERNVELEYGRIYRAALWIYVSRPSTQIAIDIIDRETGEIYGEAVSETFWAQSSQWTSIELYFRVPAESELKCDPRNAIISFRNHNISDQGNDYYIDNVSLAKLQEDPACAPIDYVDLKCPYKKLIITNPMLRNRIK